MDFPYNVPKFSMQNSLFIMYFEQCFLGTVIDIIMTNPKSIKDLGKHLLLHLTF